jgi:hypothetical protein
VASTPQRSQDVTARACFGECGPIWPRESRTYLVYVRLVFMGKELVPRGVSCRWKRSAEA